MNQPIIQIQQLTKHFGKKTALDDLSLNIERGDINAIVGSNGAGKSTLFRLLLGLQTPAHGQAFILGEDCQKLSRKTRGKIGYVNEEHTLPGWMRVDAIKAMQKALYPKWDEEIYKEVIGNFDVDPAQKVSSLSRGERAGFNLSMALAQSPEVLILDEPTLGLDVVAKQAFLESLMFTASADFSTQHCTIIYCSHQMDEIERIADQLIILENGKLRNQSSPDEFLSQASFWTVDFNDITTDVKHPAVLSQRVIDGQHHIYTFNHDDTFEAFLKSIDAKNIHNGPISLDQAVNAFLTQNHKRSQITRPAA